MRAVTRTLMGAALVIGCAISVAACTDGGNEVSGGRVVLSSDRDGNPELYVIDLAGGSSTRLTDNDFFDGNPDWSPDGSRIAFTSDGDGSLELYVMDADGSDVARLTRDAGYQGAADWSPDGSQLVYDADDEEGVLQVFVTDIVGDTEVRQLTSGAANGKPVWSPDGDQIAFISVRDVDQEIYVMAADGDGQVNLTNHPAGDIVPAWSPDGAQIALASDRDGNREIYVMAADGSNPTRLTDNPAEDSNPSWSPDGNQIVFTSDRDGDVDIYTMTSDGSEVINLTHNSTWDQVPDWTGLAMPAPGEPSLIDEQMGGPGADLLALIEDVGAATASRYGARDDLGNEMDTVKIIDSPEDGGFVGVYHSYRDEGGFSVHLATSTDLMTWTWRVALARQASMPTIARTSEGGFVLAWEQQPDNHLKLAYYRSWADLLGATPSKTYEPPRRLSSCAEGTPNLYFASETSVDLGFHYYASCDLDSQARGTTDWRAWTASADVRLDGAVRANDVHGGVGDRDTIEFGGSEFTVIEGQAINNDWTTWGIYLYEEATGRAQPINVRTHAGSTAFTNPTVQQVEIDGRPALVVTLFVPQEGEHGNEAGELIYYTLLPEA